MITVSEALATVLGHAPPSVARAVALSEALGLCLAEDVASDIDSPPHDKALVDGYAVIAADVGSAVRTNAATSSSGTPPTLVRTAAPTCIELEILEEVVAGSVPTLTVIPGTATRVMTGAPLPPGADAMVMVEETEPVDESRVRIRSAKVTPGQNILRRAVAMRRGDVVLRAGHELRPSDVGLLAEVGRDRVNVIPRPTVAILSTGNELVPAAETPGPGQIRNSNGPMLAALVQSAGATPRNLGIARDEPRELRRLIADGLRSDVLVLSGGVSAGVLDLVPGILTELGVRQVFHKVNLKPGKPLWFGVGANAECGMRNAELATADTGVPHSEFRIPHSPTLVFGLPGNPVSTLVCFELFVRSALRRLAGHGDAEQPPMLARLTKDFTHKGNRPTYHPARLDVDGGQAVVAPVAWQGSADLRAFAAANALIHFPEGDRHFPAGQEVAVLRLE